MKQHLIILNRVNRVLSLLLILAGSVVGCVVGSIALFASPAAQA